MLKARRHDRISIMADLIIQPGDPQPARFTGKVFNVSKSGLAVFSRQSFPPGKLTRLELVLPRAGGTGETFTLFGVTRRLDVQPDGNVLGIELVADSAAGDYERLAQYINTQDRHPHLAGGFTLIEACIAMTIICLLVTLAMPTFRLAVEQARADNACANLKTVWSAQRVYWLEYHTYTNTLGTLQGLDLLDNAVAGSSSNPSAVYVYQVNSADGTSFQVRALRNGSGTWNGQLQIDQDGGVSGTVSGPSGVVTPTQ